MMHKRTLCQNTLDGVRYKHWSLPETFTYFIKGVARELNIFPSFFLKCYENISFPAFKKRWLKQDGKTSCFDFNGAKLVDISGSTEKMRTLRMIFEDVFLFPCYYHDNYDKQLVQRLDLHMLEGPYGYTDGLFNVTIEKNDVVIDAGAWIGDFSAYAASKGATAFAFEPIKEIYDLLCETKMLNNVNEKGQIYPVQKGLGDHEFETNIFIDESNSGSNSIVLGANFDGEKVSITTLDKFVEDNNLERVDFIKADIEGSERDLLKGATNVLKTFAPKLAICTYHLPDDPEVLEKIIKDANPNYTIVHLRHKLFASVIKKL